MVFNWLGKSIFANWRQRQYNFLSFLQNELFDKARNEILDEVLTLSEITPQMWEDAITKHLWSAVAPHFIETIYLPAAQADNPSNFNTSVDIKLKQWADRTLPDISVKVLRVSNVLLWIVYITKRKQSRRCGN